MPLDKTFGAARRELRESRFLAPVGLAVAAIAIAWRESRVVAYVVRSATHFQGLPYPARRRYLILTIAVALIVHLLLGMFVPARVAPLWLVRRG